jgi:Ser-tRNA(Ala) deacylase AlaX
MVPPGRIFVRSLGGLEVGQIYPFAIDVGWRRLNTHHHTEWHLLAAVSEAAFPGVEAINGHH